MPEAVALPCPALQDYGELEHSLRAVLQQRGLQQCPGFLKKAVQMWDTMCVRFGLMLVGPSGSGKSTCGAALQGALTRLRQDLNHPNEQFQVRAHMCDSLQCMFLVPPLCATLRKAIPVLELVCCP